VAQKAHSHAPEAYLSVSGTYTGKGEYVWAQHLVPILMKLAPSDFLGFLHKRYTVTDDVVYRLRFQEETKTLTVLFLGEDGVHLFTCRGDEGRMNHVQLHVEQVLDICDLLNGHYEKSS